MHGSTFYDTAKSADNGGVCNASDYSRLEDKQENLQSCPCWPSEVFVMLWKNNQFFTDISFPKVKDRPLIVAHLGAHMNYLASWNVMVDNEAPFVLVCDDLSPAYPDGWWSPHSHNNAEYFARISNPQGIDKRTEIQILDFRTSSSTGK